MDFYLSRENVSKPHIITVFFMPLYHEEHERRYPTDLRPDISCCWDPEKCLWHQQPPSHVISTEAPQITWTLALIADIPSKVQLLKCKSQCQLNPGMNFLMERKWHYILRNPSSCSYPVYTALHHGRYLDLRWQASPAARFQVSAIDLWKRKKKHAEWQP